MVGMDKGSAGTEVGCDRLGIAQARIKNNAKAKINLIFILFTQLNRFDHRIKERQGGILDILSCGEGENKQTVLHI